MYDGSILTQKDANVNESAPRKLCKNIRHQLDIIVFLLKCYANALEKLCKIAKIMLTFERFGASMELQSRTVNCANALFIGGSVRKM